jgi:hypothetical protein
MIRRDGLHFFRWQQRDVITHLPVGGAQSGQNSARNNQPRLGSAAAAVLSSG